jgi:hypothetical protein
MSDEEKAAVTPWIRDIHAFAIAYSDPDKNYTNEELLSALRRIARNAAKAERFEPWRE